MLGVDIAGTTVYRNVEQYGEAKTGDGIIILRVDAPIYFANVGFVKDKLRHYELLNETRVGSFDNLRESALRFVILEMSPVVSINSTGIHALKEIISEYKSRGIHLALANPCPAVMHLLEKADLPSLIGREFLFLRVHDAVQACIAMREKRSLLCIPQAPPQTIIA